MRIINYKTDNFVSSHRGTLPFVLSCPHDGGEDMAVTERTDNNQPTTACPYGGLKKGRDVNTAIITKGIAEKILEITGETPYVVIANFKRRFIDGNRPANEDVPNCAFVDEKARVAYNRYHDTIEDFCKEISRNQNTYGFLFDIHGTNGEDPSADLYLGTRNGRTIFQGFGRERLFLRRGLRTLFDEVLRKDNNNLDFGYKVHPFEESEAEIGAVNGGHTIVIHSQFINAIQLEIDDRIRQNDEYRTYFMEDAAHCIVNFVSQYFK
jgi:hypothetical protein